MSEPTEDAVMAALKEVIDPELGVNVVDLGLVYGVEISGQGDVQVIMTLTTPGCPLNEAIDGAVQRSVGGLPGVNSVSINLVWSPPWSPEMMTPEGKTALGWTSGR